MFRTSGLAIEGMVHLFSCPCTPPNWLECEILVSMLDYEDKLDPCLFVGGGGVLVTYDNQMMNKCTNFVKKIK